jgi:NAD(P)-dependent dehydrogenase (short-subunit alcohol dehydrogenase family)
VVATSRDPVTGERAVADLREEGLEVKAAVLDVASRASVDECARGLASEGIDVDVLVNNAGVVKDRGGVLDLDDGTLAETLEVNLFGPLRAARAFIPGMVARRYGRVVNVSSGAGAICEDVSSYAPGYSISKAALDMLTRKLAVAVGGADVKVNAMCPGWVRTDMGGNAAPRSPEEAADTIVWLATLPADGPTNGFFRDRKRIAW